MIDAGGQATRKGLKLLEQTAMALHLVFTPERTITAITAEIAKAVDRARRATGRART